jgi:hypothetical protein
MTEEWRTVYGFEAYEASRDGRVRKSACKTPVRVTTSSPGYSQVFLRIGVRKYYRPTIARVILLAFVGPPSHPDMEAAHWDGNPQNNCIENLRWATPKENYQDRERHGTWPRKEKHPNWLRTHELSKRAIELLKTNKQREVARILGVGRSTVQEIARDAKNAAFVTTSR